MQIGKSALIWARVAGTEPEHLAVIGLTMNSDYLTAKARLKLGHATLQ